MTDAQLRVLASAILYRTCLRAGTKTPTPEEKMSLHARVEEAAWDLPAEMLRELEGREVDDGVPVGDEWQALVRRLVAP